MTPDPERLERSLRAWLIDARPPVADRDARIQDILAALDERPQQRRGVLQRLRDRGRHDARAGGRYLLNAFALVALIAVGAVVVSSLQRSSTEPASLTGDTFIVAADGSGDFSTISAAIDAADDGDTILVRPGHYSGAVLIDKDITLRGLGPAADVRIAIDAAVANRGDGRPVGLRLEQSDATVGNLSISGPSDAVGIEVRGGSPTLNGLILGHEDREQALGWTAFYLTDDATPLLRDSQWDGYLAVRGGAGPAIEDNVVLAASIVSIDGPGTTTLRGNRFLAGSAASISWYARGQIEANEFDGGGGIGIDTQSDVVVMGNTIRGADSAQAAIFLLDIGTRARIEGNTIVDSHHGIDLGSGTAGTVVGNVFLDNGIAVNIETSQADIADNSIKGGRVGVFVAKDAAPTISGNSVTDVVQQGMFLGSKARPTVRQNHICGSWRNLVVIAGAQPTLEDNEICEDEPAS